MSLKTGIVYVVTGETYRRECRISIESVREQMPDVPITVFTDERFESEHVDQFEIIEEPAYGSKDTIRCLPASPYEKTIYLDSDTYLGEDISEVFEMLSEFDLCIVIDPLHSESSDYRENPVSSVPSNVPEYNTGVIPYKQNERTAEFFDTWLNLFESQQDLSVDQPSFRDALYFSDLQILPLPPEYNCFYGALPGYVNGPVKVFHSRLTEHGQFKGIDFSYDPERIRKKLNSTHEPRTYTHIPWFSIHSDSTKDTNVVYRLLYNINHYGYVKTLKRAREYIRNQILVLDD